MEVQVHGAIAAAGSNYRFMVSSILSILRVLPRSPRADEGSGNTDFKNTRAGVSNLVVIVIQGLSESPEQFQQGTGQQIPHNMGSAAPQTNALQMWICTHLVSWLVGVPVL